MALVAHGDEFERAQYFAANTRKFGVEVMVFANLEVAAIWLGLNPSEAEKQIMSMSG